MLHSELNLFITCMTSPLAWSQWGWEHMPKGNADELRNLPGLISVALLCGVYPIIIYRSTADDFHTKMLALVSLFLICCLSLPRKWSSPWLSAVTLWRATQRTAASAFLNHACSRYPCRCGASEDYFDGHWDGCPCTWSPKQPLDIMSCLTTLLPEPHRNTDPSCWHRTHWAPHPCRAKETWWLPVLACKLWSLQQVWGSRTVQCFNAKLRFLKIFDVTWDFDL